MAPGRMGEMSLAEVAKALASGQVTNVVNLVATVVHAVIAEFEAVRGEHDEEKTWTLGAVNRLEDRTGQAIVGSCDGLRVEMSAAVKDLSARMILLDERMLSLVDENNRKCVEDICEVDERLGERIDGVEEAAAGRVADLMATLKTRVERLERAIVVLERVAKVGGKLEGYGGGTEG
jgi:hypothetical protein